MNFSEAVKLMEQGKRVTRKSWSGRQYLIKNNAGGISMSGREGDVNGLHTPPFNGNTFGDDWEEFDERVELSTLKVGDKYKLTPHGIIWLILPNEMAKYESSIHLDKGDIPVVDINSDYLSVVQDNVRNMVYQVKGK